MVAALLRRLWIQPPRDHAFASLEQMRQRWADEFEQRDVPYLDPGLVRAGLALFRELPATATSSFP